MLLKKQNIPPVLVIIYCTVIFAFSSVPAQELPGLPAADYILHGIEYAGLGVLLFWWRITAGESMNMALVQSIITASFYGITDEFHQSFIPGRCMSITDWAADTIGAVIGSSIMLLIFSVKENIHLQSGNEQETDSNTQ